ncbi:MAG: hypothetical protein ACO1O6_03375 [Bacteroidota bacterium]
MKTNILIFALVLGTGITFISCEKDKEEEHATATISFEEPVTGDTIASGAEMHMEGTILGTGELHGYTLSVINAANQAVLFTKTYDTHASSYNFHEHWVNNVTDTTAVKVRMDVTEDHDGNHEIKEVNVVCLP